MGRGEVSVVWGNMTLEMGMQEGSVVWGNSALEMVNDKDQ